MGPEQLRYKLDEVLEAESLLIGHVTYESFAGAWPQRSQREQRAALDGGRDEMIGFADKMNAIPKHVVSTTLRNPAWNNSRVINADVAGEVARLRKQADGPILVAGSPTLVHTLIEQDLVDEYRLMIFPVVLGSGRRLFPETKDKTVLRLAETRAFSTGVAVHSYHGAAA
ncbi:MAG TPA: dihydrofolate reductase family protein [Burkholderiales bacterium]|nr:dihydrofolate reductase family protein [Burkholderiales bacterium]